LTTGRAVEEDRPTATLEIGASMQESAEVRDVAGGAA